MEGSDMMESALDIFTSLGHQAVEVGMGICLLSECLNDNTRVQFCAGSGLEVFEESLDSCPAKVPQEPALVPEEDAQHLGDRKDDL